MNPGGFSRLHTASCTSGRGTVCTPHDRTLTDTLEAMDTAQVPSLRTWVCVVTPTPQISKTCAEFGLTTPQILLVLATRGGAEALRARMVTLGLSQAADKKTAPHIVQAVEESITSFSGVHAEHLLARTGTGRRCTAVDESGVPYTVWANLEPLLPVSP